MKNIIITGASKGIGREAALSLAAKGAGKILAIARNPHKLKELKTIIESHYPKTELLAYSFDLMKDDYEKLNTFIICIHHQNLIECL